MIFEGTKNQFFFGLELTRAGLFLSTIIMTVTETLVLLEEWM